MERERTAQLRAIRATAEAEIERLDAELGACGVRHGKGPIVHTDAADARREWAADAYWADAQLSRLEECDE